MKIELERNQIMLIQDVLNVLADAFVKRPLNVTA